MMKTQVPLLWIVPIVLLVIGLAMVLVKEGPSTSGGFVPALPGPRQLFGCLLIVVTVAVTAGGVITAMVLR